MTGQLRREMLRAVDGRQYSRSLIDAYAQEQLQSPGQFKGFLERFREVKNRILKDIGGASGLPRGPSRSVDAAGWTQQDIAKWLKVFRDVTTSTRVFQADLYFGHALFGLMLRRLARRFELAVLSFEDTLEDLDPAMASERFGNFVEMAAKTADGTLDQVLELSPCVLKAIRRQTDAIFGQDLRDELQRPIDRAAEVDSSDPDAPDAPPIARHTSMLLDAAERGELRMLSVSLEGKERIMWDALTFGAFLQDAEDELTKSLV